MLLQENEMPLPLNMDFLEDSDQECEYQKPRNDRSAGQSTKSCSSQSSSPVRATECLPQKLNLDAQCWMPPTAGEQKFSQMNNFSAPVKMQGEEGGLDFQTQESNSIFECSDPFSQGGNDASNGNISSNRNNKIQRDWKCRRCQTDNISSHMRCL